MKNNQRSSPSNVQAPRTEAFLPMLFVVICLLATLVALIIDRFIYHYGADMLSPALSQIVLLLIPACLCLMLQTPEHKASSRFREIGVRGLEARYVFLTIFTALFMICMSFVLNILFGGVQIAAKGLSRSPGAGAEGSTIPGRSAGAVGVLGSGEGSCLPGASCSSVGAASRPQREDNRPYLHVLS